MLNDRMLAACAATIGCSGTFLFWMQLGWHSWTVYLAAITLPCIAWAIAEWTS